MARIKRIEPGPGQESVWDYPRPPRVEPTERHIRVVAGGETVAESRRAKRVLETSGAPVYYVPPEDVRLDLLRRTDRRSLCEWKGVARYFDIKAGGRKYPDAAWVYPEPTPGYEAIAGHIAFYPHELQAYVDGERARPQPGGFYGGWVTSDVVGPFKGGPGSAGW